MKLIFLMIIFLVIVVLIWMKRPLYLAMAAGILAAIILFRVSPLEAVKVLTQQTIAKETISLLLSFYFITFLQLMLESKGRLVEAKKSFNALFRNRRINCIIPPAIIGLLPSAAVMTICAQMVDDTAENYLSDKEKTFVSCFYRHIPEMFLPTFPVIILACSLSQQNMGKFVILMIPLVIIDCLIVYLFYLRRVPNENIQVEGEVNARKEVFNLFRNLWSLIAILMLIIAFGFSATTAAPLVIVINFFLDHFTAKDLPHLLVHAAEPLLLGNMYLVMLFKGILSYTGAIQVLPEALMKLPIPVTVSFALIFFAGTIISGSQAMIALCMTMAYMANPKGGIGYLVMIMGIVWAAMEISPTHVCSFVAANYYHTTLGDLVVKAIPCVILCSIAAYIYGGTVSIFF